VKLVRDKLDGFRLLPGSFFSVSVAFHRLPTRLRLAVKVRTEMLLSLVIAEIAVALVFSSIVVG
jgi:hypothetical protein